MKDVFLENNIEILEEWDNLWSWSYKYYGPNKVKPVNYNKYILIFLDDLTGKLKINNNKKNQRALTSLKNSKSCWETK